MVRTIEVDTETASRMGWQRVVFGEMAESVTDRVDDPSLAGVERYVGLEHLDPGSLRINRWSSPDEVIATKLRFKPGDIIFGRRRAYQRKLAVADFEGICSAHALVLRAREDVVSKDFLPFFMQSDTFFERALAISVGSLSPTINWKTLARQEFALPPKPEQERIAEILDGADSSIRGMELAIRAAKDVRESFVEFVASSLVGTSKLTELAEVIDAQRPIAYGILKPGLDHPGGIPVIKVRNYPSGAIEGELQKTSPEIDNAYHRSRLREGDLLLSIRGTVGRVAEVPASLDGANITQDTARIALLANVYRPFIRVLLESQFVQRQIRSRITGLAVKGINLGEVRKLRLPIPDREAQIRVAKYLTHLDHATHTLEAHRDLLSLTRRKLLQHFLRYGHV